MTTDLFQVVEPRPSTQQAEILKYLRQGMKLTGLDALELCGTMKLATRIGELRGMGHTIHSEMIETGSSKHVSIYWIKK